MAAKIRAGKLSTSTTALSRLPDADAQSHLRGYAVPTNVMLATAPKEPYTTAPPCQPLTV